jgi:hypothetical protein
MERNLATATVLELVPGDKRTEIKLYQAIMAKNQEVSGMISGRK